jgi:glycosyltransferase involved in cell wall biosynthesis
MKISFICNYIYINDGWSPWDIRIGGSEEFIVEVSRRLAKRGHTVQVFHNGRHGEFEGVLYRDHSEFEPGDVVINVNYPEFTCDAPQILWTSLTKHPNLSHFKAVCYISEYARENTGIVHDNLHWVPPGYDETKIYPDTKVAKQCFYASSPDRGLDTLLEAWPSVYSAHPNATLLLTYGAPRVDLPGVINLGTVDEETMNEIYRTSEVWCHPCNGGELYCMTGIKAQAAHCWPVVIPVMALAETVRFGTLTTKDEYTQALVKALGSDHDIPHYEFPTWSTVTDRLLKVIETVV